MIRLVCPALVSAMVPLQHFWSLYQCYFSLDDSGRLLLLSLLFSMNTTINFELFNINDSKVIPLMNQGLKLTRFVNWNICLSRIMRFFPSTTPFNLFSGHDEISKQCKEPWKCTSGLVFKREGWEQEVDRKIPNVTITRRKTQKLFILLIRFNCITFKNWATNW